MREGSLVTGANGFIGAALTRRLERDGCIVHRLVRRSTTLGEIVVELGRDPIPPLQDLRLAAVYHLAGRVHEADDGPDAEEQHWQNTVSGTKDLIHAAAEGQVGVFIYFSSCAVLGEGRPNNLAESAPPSPGSAYARSKLAAEQIVLSANRPGGMRTVCLRLPLVYGVGHKGSLPRMMRAIEHGHFPPIPEFGNHRSMVHVDDVVEAALRVARSPVTAGRTYTVAEPRSYSSREVYEILMRAFGRQLPRWRVPTSVFRLAAAAGDVTFGLTGRRIGFDSSRLAKLSKSATYMADELGRDVGFRTVRVFANCAAEIVRSAESNIT